MPLVEQAFMSLLQRGTTRRIALAVATGKGLCSKKGSPLTLSSSHSMVTNAFYAGFIRCGEKLYRGTHDPIIFEEVFHCVQAKLNERQIGQLSPNPDCTVLE